MEANPASVIRKISSIIVELVNKISHPKGEEWNGAYESTLFPDPAIYPSLHQKRENEKRRKDVRLP
jgi:hypothetical protein